jgi:threonyl-tRNA synthetase
VDGEVWDLERPLEASCKLELLDFEHPEGSTPSYPYSFAFSDTILYRKTRFLALVCTRLGRSRRTSLRLPSLSWSSNRRWILLRNGYPRPVRLSSSAQVTVFIFFPLRPVTNADYPALEKVAELAIKDKQKFERLVVSKENLLKMFGVRVFLFCNSL